MQSDIINEMLLEPCLNFDALLSQSKLDKRLNTFLTCFWYINTIYDTFSAFHTHFIQFRYDFLSSIIIWYTFECIKVYLIYLLTVSVHLIYLLSVSKLYQKWIKTRCPTLIGSKVQPGIFFKNILLPWKHFCHKVPFSVCCITKF